MSLKYKLLEYSDGQQALAAETDRMRIRVQIDDVELVAEKEIDVTEEEFADLQLKAKTEYIESDTIRGKEMSITTPMVTTDTTEDAE